MRRTAVVAGLMLIGMAVQSGWAFSLGIPLDGFITQLLTSVVGLGLVVGSIGLVGWIGSLFDNPFSNILSGSVSFFTKAGILGGGAVILPALGLVGGATL
jgi:hypothetical protein